MSKKINETPAARAKRIAQLKPQKAGTPAHNPKGRGKGVPNRATVIKKFLLAATSGNSKEFGIKDGEMTVADKMVLKQLQKALQGDLNAYKELMDSVFGKIPEKFIEAKEDEEPDLKTPGEAEKALEKLLKNVD